MALRIFLLSVFLLVSSVAGHAQADFNTVYVEPNIASGASDGGGAAMKSLAETFWNLYQSNVWRGFFFSLFTLSCIVGLVWRGLDLFRDEEPLDKTIFSIFFRFFVALFCFALVSPQRSEPLPSSMTRVMNQLASTFSVNNFKKTLGKNDPFRDVKNSAIRARLQEIQLRNDNWYLALNDSLGPLIRDTLGNGYSPDYLKTNNLSLQKYGTFEGSMVNGYPRVNYSSNGTAKYVSYDFIPHADYAPAPVLPAGEEYYPGGDMDPSRKTGLFGRVNKDYVNALIPSTDYPGWIHLIDDFGLFQTQSMVDAKARKNFAPIANANKSSSLIPMKGRSSLT